ncbi:hypothetical protein B0J12DRAFT_151598 [Macrophomina phaseolina]|uniref:Uncharacterized protein n=1 Tax=Macrophomina phaseolina TaxID=35725 RepID=A0ABQ8G513_9PEZI|nr:hypothetical protein B0J12DRAFT_151598 [Macrophomina phaseolina]
MRCGPLTRQTKCRPKLLACRIVCVCACVCARKPHNLFSPSQDLKLRQKLTEQDHTPRPAPIPRLTSVFPSEAPSSAHEPPSRTAPLSAPSCLPPSQKKKKKKKRERSAKNAQRASPPGTLLYYSPEGLGNDVRPLARVASGNIQLSPALSASVSPRYHDGSHSAHRYPVRTEAIPPPAKLKKFKKTEIQLQRLLSGMTHRLGVWATEAADARKRCRRRRVTGV